MPDPTRTRERELSLLEHEDVYRQILDAVDDLVLVKGAHSRILWANRAFRAYYGMSNEALQQLIDAPFNTPDNTQQYIADDLQVFTTGQSLDIPVEAVTRHDGTVNHFHTVKTALRDEHGVVRMTVGVSRNIGETLALREQVLRFREQQGRDRLSAFAAQLPGVLFQMRHDSHGFHFTYASPSVAEYYGVDASEVLADARAVMKNVVDADAAVTTLAAAWADARNDTMKHVHRVRGRAGVARVMEVFLRRQRERDGSDTLYAYAHDVTDRERASAEREALIDTLRARTHEMEQFTYTISHDLKSPLVTIRGFVSGIEEDLREGRLERAQQDLARVRGAAEKMARMLEELLELSRVGRVAQRLSSFAIGEVVTEVRELLAARLKSGAEVVVAGGDVVVEADRGRIVQVLQNLIENAAKYGARDTPPRVEVRCRRDGDVVAIDVVDNGIGIDPAHHQRVFALFEKLDARSEGTGVGLALVKSIVELHRGRVWVESAGVGQGTTVHVRLPAGASAPPAARPR